MNFSEFLQPAIFGLTGKPGAGKSYFATRVLIAEIMEGRNRPIVTNVPINKEKLREYVKKDFYVYELDTYTDNKAFFANRGYYKLEVDDLGANVDFQPLLKPDDEGVLFIIDEAHLYFNARNWKHMPQATISYITTIRHVGDSLIWMCQRFSDIDSQIRGKTQAFHLLRNLEKEKIGMFKRGTGFRCYQYQEEQHISSHGSSQTSLASQDFTYPFDIRVAECYSTSLFNKSHDKKYRVKALPLKYFIWAGCLVFVGLLYWLSQGGYRDMISWVTPDMVDPVSEDIGEVANTEMWTPDEAPVLISTMDTYHMELPIHTFGIDTEDLETQNFSRDEIEQKLNYYFGDTRRCTLTYISDKKTSEQSKGFSFQASWNEYIALNNIAVQTQSGIHQVKTPFFRAYLEYEKSRGNGNNIKEITLYLKENIPYQLRHGYEIPQQTTTATNQFVQTNSTYKEIGFELEIVFEDIESLEILKYTIKNSDVLDAVSESPTLQTFFSSNVLDVRERTTYQLADFISTQNYSEKGFLKKKELSTRVQNRVFLSYGNDI